MEIKIEKNIPIPDKVQTQISKIIVELKKLEVNDSYLVDNSKNLPLPQLRNQTNSKLIYYGKKLNYKFTIRQTEEGLRVWRVK